MNILEKIEKLELILPPAPKPLGVYKPTLIIDNFLYVSGQGPVKSDGSLIIGKVGKDMDKHEAKKAARQVGLTMISSIVSNIENVERFKRIVKVFGMVNSSPNFYDHPFVINGFSELMSEIFGEDLGIGVRSAVGMTLPGNIPVEIEAKFELYN